MKQSTLVLALVGLAIAGLLGWFLFGGDPAASVDPVASGPGAAVQGDGTAAAPARPSAPARPQATPSGLAEAAGPSGAREVLAAAAREEGVEAEAAGPFLVGRVVDRSGRGIAGASVRFSNGADIAGPRTFRVIGAVVSRSKSGETDGNGSYRVADPGLDAPTVTVSAPGFQPLELEDLVLPEGPGDRLVEDIVLEPGVILEGQVVDDRGRPIAAAELSLVDPDDNGLVFSMGDDATADATTDEAGGFRLDRVGLGTWAVQVNAEGHPLRVFRGSAELTGLQPTLRFEVPTGAKIRGRAIGVPEGRENEFTVRASPLGAMPFAAFAGAGTNEAPLAEDGSFELGGLDPAREYQVELTEPGTGMFAMVGAGSPRSAKVNAAAGSEGLELLFRPPATVRFQVVEASGGRPIERFEASLGFAFNQRKIEDAEGETKTLHIDGNAAFTDLYEEDFRVFGEAGLRVRVDAEGYASSSVEIEELEEGEDLDLGRIELRDAPPLRVVVRDVESGEPIENARVELRPMPDDEDDGWGFMAGIDMASQTRRTKTDANGRAEVTSIPGVVCRLEVDKGGRAPFVKTDVLTDTAIVELEVELGEGGELIVDVVDESGARVGGAEVEHRGPGETEVRGTRKTSSKRGARFRDLEPGDHSFRVAEDDGSSGRRGRWRVGDEESKGEWTPVRVVHGFEDTLTLVVRSKGAVYGVVRELGRPLVGALVAAIELPEDADEREQELARQRTGFGWSQDEVRTGADGSFRLEGLTAGRRALVIEHERRAMPEVIEFEMRGAEVRVDADLDVTVVRGRVVDAEGAPVAGIEVEALPGERAAGRRNNWRGFNTLDAMGVEVVDVDSGGSQAAPIGEGRTAADGTFELRGVAHGQELRAVASADFVIPGLSEPFTLKADETLEGLEIVVSPAGAMVVTIAVAPDAESARFVSVEATREVEVDPGDLEFVLGGATSNSFSFGGAPARLNGLEPGRWTVVARERSRQGERRESEPVIVDVLPGETRELTVLLR